MGHVYQNVTLSANKKATRVRMFVDTGATFSVISPKLAEKIGLVGLKKSYRLSLATGLRVTMKAGAAIVRLLGREAPSIVLVGNVEEPILGVETLEALGLAVDPACGKLRKTRTWTVRVGGAWRGRRLRL
ncbi:MAG: retroviral-like aspartic protease family protein [Planctomycetota bacterium]|nr:retroviral-like aspartic protease family protein [Planctomycetota bacterium]